MMDPALRYFIIHKPYNMVSQFVSPHQVRLLGELGFDFPEGTHAVGRLDNHSEGLLILTTDKRVTRLLFEGPVRHERTYLVLVKKKLGPAALQQLREGPMLRFSGDEFYHAKPVSAAIVEPPAYLLDSWYEFNPHCEYTWLSITLTEGKYHQVRKMVAAIGHRCVRLIRTSIEGLTLDGMEPGSVREVEGEEFFRKLKIIT